MNTTTTLPAPAPARPRAAAARLEAWFRPLLRVPLYYKILGANAATVITVAMVGTLATAALVRAAPDRGTLDLVGFFASVGVLASVLVNALILRVALLPLDALDRTATRVQRGDLEARAELSPLADRDIERLVATFNEILDNNAGYRQRLRDMAARALRATEEERKRVSHELHDETAQRLAALLVSTRLARRASDAELRDALLEEIGRETAAAIEDLRRIAKGLRPPALDMLGLAAALESHARGLADSTGLVVELEAEPVAGLLAPEAEIALYRVVQEALTNVARHARARRVRVRVARRAGWIEASVEDDGRGFRVDDVLASDDAGLGLFGMRERASYVGGRVEIGSEPGQGTRVRVQIPIAKAS